MSSFNRSKLFYLASICVTNAGNSISFLSAGKLIYDQVGAAAVFAAIIGAEHIQSSLLSFSSGVLVDRWGSKRVAVLSDVFFALISFAMAAGLFWRGLTLIVPLGMILSNFIKPFYRSSTFAMLKHICEDEDTFKMNSLTSLFQQVGYFSGLALAALFLSSSNISQLLVFDGFTFIVSAIFLSLVKLNELQVPTDLSIESSPSKSPSIGKLREILKEHLEIIPFVRQNSALLKLLIIIVIQLLVIDAFNLSLFKLAKIRYPEIPSALAIIDGSYAVGVILMAIIQSRIKKLQFPSTTLPFVLLLEATFFMSIGLAQSIWLTVLFVILFALTISSVFSHTFSELYSLTPKNIAGRIGGLRGLMLGLAGMVFTLASGFAIDLSGVLGAFMLGSCLLIIGACLRPNVASIAK
jgi:MFS family permease